MSRKNTREIFGLLNKFSFSNVRSGVSFFFFFFFFLLSSPLSHSLQGINHRETIADDLNERNLLELVAIIFQARTREKKTKKTESRYAIVQMRSSSDRCLTINTQETKKENDNQFTSVTIVFFCSTTTQFNCQSRPNTCRFY